MNTDITELHIDNRNPDYTSDLKEFELLSLNEVRKILKVGYSNLKMIIAEGKLKATRINSRYKISMQSLKRYIDSISDYPVQEFQNKNNEVSQCEIQNILTELKEKYSKYTN